MAVHISKSANPPKGHRIAAWRSASQKMWRRRATGILLIVLLAGGAALTGCTSLPALDARTSSTVLGDTAGTTLGVAIGPLTAAHPGLAGIYPLADGRDAFSARVLLVDAAQRSLDVQYYMWHDDITGTLLFNSLRAAAARGVRVRLLLDDNTTGGQDRLLAALGAVPNLEVRLFNPFALRAPRALNYLTDFPRLNRRMHNKSLTADNQATIIGGRNIGDEYFGAAGDVLFSDLDVIAIGPVVNAVSHDFDRYWNSPSAYPVKLLLAPASADSIADVRAEGDKVVNTPEARAYQEAVRNSPFVKQLVARELPLAWSHARLVSDDPAKVLDKGARKNLVVSKLVDLLGQPEKELALVSPYFVPGKGGAQAFEDMARRGVKVRILTNSFEATDVAAVHAGYMKWRKPLLESGVELFESRAAWADGDREKRAGRFGSSASSLHAKTFAVDGKQVFVGSFNVDQRSFELNTEMGFVIDSPALATQLTTALKERIPTRAYQVKLDADGTLYWIEHKDGATIRYDTEPGTTWWKRAGINILSVLPIDWML